MKMNSFKQSVKILYRAQPHTRLHRDQPPTAHSNERKLLSAFPCNFKLKSNEFFNEVVFLNFYIHYS